MGQRPHPPARTATPPVTTAAQTQEGGEMLAQTAYKDRAIWETQTNTNTPHIQEGTHTHTQKSSNYHTRSKHEEKSGRRATQQGTEEGSASALACGLMRKDVER